MAGLVWIEKYSGFRYFRTFKLFLKGRKKGMYRVTLPDGSHVDVDESAIRRMPT